MTWRAFLVVLIMLAPGSALADLGSGRAATTSQVCRDAIAAAERAHGIPAHLLAAIARVESGRRDEASGTFNPWPWTINFDGQGSFYDNKSQAVAAAASMRPRATKSVDVGCMQISLTHHPDAFASLETAFDPAANADYAARFLVQLFAKTNAWPKAVQLYHSATPELGEEYGRRVYAAWPEEQRVAATSQPSALPWASTVNTALLLSPLRPAVPHIIPMQAVAGGGVPAGRSLASYRLSRPYGWHCGHPEFSAVR